ncbi:gamma-glutamylputrescine synthetase [Halocatena salina]|uniref:Glutamine synthetase family protein n=1 Tax=Halocatena salina TaxID=2934340 RepID=A0A8U0A1K6_9EURY|nr:gamma-glutamylputrescine synthetase [Halocatena salina]UPM41933.1 glutamine synthetase family protein [Halocatena salina]
MPTSSDIARRCETEDIDLVRLLFVTPNGVVRAQSVAADDIATAIDEGVPASKLVHAYNALGFRKKDGRFDAAGEVLLRPDPATFRTLPYADRCGGMLCDVRTLADSPWAADPRTTLSSLIETIASADLVPSVAFESEFHLLAEKEDELVPTDGRGAYATASTRDTHEFVLAVRDALADQGISVGKYYPEWGAGKHEIVLDHGPALTAADEHVLFKETVESVAATHGYQATFLPKPATHSTNGCHIHCSLWDGSNNRFAGSDGISETAASFIAGVLEHAPGLTALTAGTVNSYARLRPQVGATAFTCWGYGNREALVRVPGHAAGATDAVRIEYRAADNTANPYIALIGLLAAGLDGIKRELSPPEPLDSDPGNLSVDERDRRGIERLPTTLREALTALADDRVLRNALGAELYQTYLDVKRSHWEAFTESAATWERDRLRNVY